MCERVVAAALALVLMAGCGGGEKDSREPATEPDLIVETEKPSDAGQEQALEQQEANEGAGAPVIEEATCDEPSGQEKAALRFNVRAHDRELKDDPWAMVREGGVNYMAAEIDIAGPRLVVLVRFPEEGKYLAGMKAINGTARTFTDLPVAGDQVSEAGEQALACME